MREVARLANCRVSLVAHKLDELALHGIVVQWELVRACVLPIILLMSLPLPSRLLEVLVTVMTSRWLPR